MTLRDVLAAAARFPEVAGRLGPLLTSDLVVPSPSERRAMEFLLEFRREYEGLPKEGDWEAWLEELPERDREGTRETVRELLARDLSAWTPEYLADHAGEVLREEAARVAVHRLERIEEGRAEALREATEEVEALRPPEEGEGDDPFGGRSSAALSNLYGLLDDDAGVEYDLPPYTAPGHTTLLSAPPKMGKSTWAAIYAVAKASGRPFLGEDLEPGNVLVVAPDEHWRHVVRRFLALGGPGDRIHVWAGARDLSIEAVAERAEEIDAGLVVLDTLLRVAGIEEENSNSEWARWFARADRVVRPSRAAWLMLHHDRKAGGSGGAAIRGASVIYGSVDVALSLREEESGAHPLRRILRTEGTRLDRAEDLVIELHEGEGVYMAVGSARVISTLRDDSVARLRSVLSEEGRTATELLGAIEARHPDEEGLTDPALRRRLEKLVRAGLASRLGSGGRGDPYRWRRTFSRPPPPIGPGRTGENAKSNAGKEIHVPEEPGENGPERDVEVSPAPPSFSRPGAGEKIRDSGSPEPPSGRTGRTPETQENKGDRRPAESGEGPGETDGNDGRPVLPGPIGGGGREKKTGLDVDGLLERYRGPDEEEEEDEGGGPR